MVEDRYGALIQRARDKQGSDHIGDAPRNKADWWL